MISVILYVVRVIVTGGSAVWVLMSDPAAGEDAAMWIVMPIAWRLICWPFTGAADGRPGAGGESDARPRSRLQVRSSVGGRRRTTIGRSVVSDLTG